MSFHLGKPILVMIVLAGVCGGGLLLRSKTSKRGDLVLWVFAEAHAKTYGGDGSSSGASLLDEFQKKSG